MKRSDQSGFAATEAVLILVIVAMVAGTGYFVWQAKQNTNDSLTNAAKSTPAVTKSKKVTTGSKVDVNEPIVTTTYSKVPAELQKAILNYTKQFTPACVVKDDVIVNPDGQPKDQVVIYWSAGWAETDIGCSGAAGTVFAENSDGWQKITATQYKYSCEDLEAYMTPAKFLAAINTDKSTICVDKTGTERQLQG